MGSKDAPQKMQFLCAMKKVASPCAFIQNTKVAETPHIFGHHLSKIGPNPNVFAYSKSLRTGTNMHKWVYDYNMPWEKVLAFLKSHSCGQKTGQSDTCRGKKPSQFLVLNRRKTQNQCEVCNNMKFSFRKAKSMTQTLCFLETGKKLKKILSHFLENVNRTSWYQSHLKV